MAADTGSGIGAAVGLGRLNDPADVRRVQHLLNHDRSGEAPRLAEDGVFGPRTASRLLEYQRDTVRLPHPDGVAEPHGPTMRSLSRTHAAAPHRRADADLTVSDYVAAHPVGGRPDAAKAWIEQALPAARAAQEKWGVPVSVTIAQGALESSWGTRHPGNAYFGVKGHGPDGGSILFATHEESGGVLRAETDSFRSYPSLEQSADDYGRFLATNKRYAAAFDHKDDGHRFIHEVAKAGYATDSHYEGKIRSIMDRHGLDRYDQAQARTREQEPGPTASAAALANVTVSQPGAAAPGTLQDQADRLWAEMARVGQEVVAQARGAWPAAAPASAAPEASPAMRPRP